VIAIKIEEASAKVRFGPPLDEQEDYSLPVWAGVLPLREMPLSPIRDTLQTESISLPGYISKYSRKRSG
jgi:hypothetical protein